MKWITKKGDKLPTSTPTKPGIFQKIDRFSIDKLFAKKRKAPTPRSVYLNTPLPYESTLNKSNFWQKIFNPTTNVGPEWIYTSNQVISSKYTIITFLPRNLLEQFRRVANLFFLGINILQFFPKFSTISPGVVILPLLIIVVITAIKDGYEDIKRHQSDRKINHSKTKVLVGRSKHSDFSYHNYNQMERKSKTFTAGIPKNMKLGKIRLRKKSKNRDHLPPPTIPDAVTSIDEEMKFESDQLGYSLNEPPELRNDPEFSDAQPYESHQMGLVDDLENPRVYTPPPPPVPLPSGPEHGQLDDEDDYGEEDDEEDDYGNRWKTTLWEDIKVGDFVKVHNNEPLPAGKLLFKYFLNRKKKLNIYYFRYRYMCHFRRRRRLFC